MTAPLDGSVMGDKGRIDSPSWPPILPRLGVKTFFFTNGFVFASWVAHIPSVKTGLSLSDGDLGLLLLAIAFGSLIALPLAGGVVSRFGSRRITFVAASGYCLLLPFLIMAGSLPPMLLGLAMFGACNATLDVAMNAQAVEVERLYDRSIMSSFHALYSFGGLAGASAASGAMAIGIADSSHVLTTSAVTLAAISIAYWFLAPGHPAGKSSDPVFALPRGVLMGLGLLALIGLLSEGAIADWSAVYLRDQLGSSPAQAATGFAAFSLTMAFGRLFGDHGVNRLGSATTLSITSLIAAAGVSLALLVRDTLMATIGFGLAGLGIANIIPILFSVAGRVKSTSPGGAIAAVATTGYLGYLVGPPVIGFVADATNLAIGLGVVSLLCLLSAGVSSKILRAIRA